MNEESQFERFGVFKEADQFGMGVQRPPDGSGRPDQPTLGQAVECDWVYAEKIGGFDACVCQADLLWSAGPLGMMR